MLDSLRKSADSWLVKALMAVLVLSFAAWGVDGFFRGEKVQNLAEVGGKQISGPEFEQNYQVQLRLLSEQFKRPITSSEARALGLPMQVLQELVGQTAIGIHAGKLGLGIEEKALEEEIIADPSFSDGAGKFDSAVFRQVLQNLGMNESYFVKLRREEAIRRQITDVLTTGAYVPQTMIDAVNHYLNDQRVMKYFLVPASAAGTVNAPDEAAITTYYDAHKSAYKAPEFRKIGMLLLNADAIKGRVQISDEEVKADYEAHKKKYGSPELRTIQQLIFKDKASAETARTKLAKNPDFVKLGEELGMKENDVNMGTFSQEKIADKKIADAAFKLEKGKVSDVIDGFSPVIIRVTEIKPGSQKTFDEVKDQIRDGLARVRASELLGKTHDEIEDARAGGATLTEIGKKLNIKYDEYTLDAYGAGTDGKKIEDLVKLPEVIKLTFNSDVGVENNPLTVAGGSAFVEVRENIPERQKPLTEVQEDVKKSWIAEETGKRLRKKVQDLMTRATGGEKIEKLAETVDAKVTTTPLIKRTDVQPGLPISALSQMFSSPLNGFGSAETPDGKSHAVFQVTEIKPAAAMDEKQAAALRNQLRRGIGSDFYAQYVNGLKNAYGVQFNTKAISDLSGQQ